jgi:hypothetical protein
VPKIFISHIHEDEEAALHLVNFLLTKLEVRPEDIFLSSNQQIHLGSEWLHAIGRALSSASVVIALFSDVAMKRQWVHFEAGGAWFNKKKCLIPLCIGGMKPVQLGKPYSNIQGADLHDWTTAHYLINTIVKTLRPEIRQAPVREFDSEDPDVKNLMQNLETWRSSRSEAQMAI